MKRSPVWQFFDEIVDDPKHAKCKLCHSLVSRGSGIKSKQTPRMLDYHLEMIHSKEWKVVTALKKKNKASMVKEKSPLNGSDECGMSSKNGSDVGETQITNLKTKAQRTEAMSATISDWVESKTKVSFHSAKGQGFHKSIFEMIIMDKQPFSIVNNLGFLRHHQRFLPNFEVRPKIKVL